MTDRDIFSFARRKERGRNRSFVFSLSFCMTLFLPLFFFSSAFFGGVQAKLKAYSLNTSLRIEAETEAELEATLEQTTKKEEFLHYQVGQSNTLIQGDYSGLAHFYPVFMTAAKEASWHGDSFRVECYPSDFLFADEASCFQKHKNKPVFLAGSWNMVEESVFLSHTLMDSLGWSWEDCREQTLCIQQEQEDSKSNRVTKVVLSETKILGIFEDAVYSLHSRGEDEKEAPQILYKSLLGFPNLSDISFRYRAIVRYPSFDTMKEEYSKLDSYRATRLAKANQNISILTNSLFAQYLNFEPLISLFTTICGVILLVLSFVLLIDWYLSFSHWYSRSRKNLGMLKALGMKQRDLEKYLWSRLLWIVLKATLISSSISLVLSLGVTILFNDFLYRTIDSLYRITFNPLYFIPGFALTLLFFLLYTLFLVWVEQRKDSRRQIVGLLNDRIR